MLRLWAKSSDFNMFLHKFLHIFRYKNIIVPLTDNPNAPSPNEDGITPLDCAIMNWHTDIIKLLESI